MTTESIFASAQLPIEEETDTSDMDNVGAALGLVIISGGATAIGAAVVYVPSLVNMANSKTLAISLGLSAGIMLFVSFIEIFGKSQSSFEEAGFEEHKAYAMAMATFFAGAFLMLITHYVLDKLMGGDHHGAEVSVGPGHPSTDLEHSSTAMGDSSTDDMCASKAKKTRKNGEKKEKKLKRATTVETAPVVEEGCGGGHLTYDYMESDWGDMMLPCCETDNDPTDELNILRQMAREMDEFERKRKERKDCIKMGIPAEALDVHQDFEGVKEEVETREKNDKLMHMSLKTAVAIALHNFPEGLATFVAALADPKVGVVLAIGVAIHNIPEGLAVALPMYYATGNRHKAFLCGALSGCTEILAALLGWAVLASAFSAIMYAVVFGIVSGMMVIISIRELLPTAHQYDPKDTYVTLSFVVGMMVMAMSLALIALC